MSAVIHLASAAREVHRMTSPIEPQNEPRAADEEDTEIVIIEIDSDQDE